MADADNNTPFAEPRQEEKHNWTPMIVGVALVAVVVAVVAFIGQSGDNKPVANRTDPYAAKLQVTNLHMSTAENFAGGSVTYIEGKLINTGDKKVTGAGVELLFKDSLGQIAQKEQLPVMVLLPNVPYVDYGPVDRAPLGPNQSRDFRLTLEHVSTDWDGQLPQVRVTTVKSN
jgi:hypothetical protein